MFGIEGYEPQWHHSGRALAAAHRARFARLIGRRLIDGWLLWDLDGGTWFADAPVILGFDQINVEVTHRKFDECAITWDQVDMSIPLDWGEPTQPARPAHPTPAGGGPAEVGLRLDWRAGAHPAVRRLRGRRLREVNVIERLMSAHWRPVVLHAVELLFDGPARLAVFNALDENGLTDAAEVSLPVGFWRRIPIA